ncbi:hypothetical protein SAMN02745177_02345 [Desulforamulus hydrothermalis Lam5 = DSM 18033]|nr:hypothetical protein SAMN02745177_02345 [Desulforamulus hydrothermalis Lam5 = DSM 18033]
MNSVVVETSKNSVITETVNIETIIHFLAPILVMEEHKEVIE